jgi:hypothetical protein
VNFPELSVVVTVVEGGAALRRCLAALKAQEGAANVEVIVPYDDTIPGVAELEARFEGFRFLPVGHIAAAGAGRDAYAEHVRYDCRRAAGLAAARGRLLAMVEDRGWPRPDWARTMIRLHRENPHGAIGGAIESGARSALGHAVFICDFGRYEPPVTAENPDFLSDINICYKREALESVRSLWQGRYQEAQVNWALRDQGAGLLLSAEPRVVQERDSLALGSMLLERIHWGRTYGQVRLRESARWKGVLMSAALPLLPPLLFLRHARSQLKKGHSIRELAGLSPALFVLLDAWALGECLGYLESSFRGGFTPRGSLRDRSPRLKGAFGAARRDSKE